MSQDFLTRLTQAVRREREAHARLLEVRREHAKAKRDKEAMVNWLADGMGEHR